MCVKHLLVGGLALLLGACSGNNKGGHAPPAPNKELLAGKWKNSSGLQFLAGFEFTEDGTAKVTFQRLKQPIPARYTWSDERTVKLEYQAPADLRRAYKKAAKAYHAELQARSKSGKLHPMALPGLEAAMVDELPDADTFRVAIADEPRMLFLTKGDKWAQTFNKAD